MSPINYPAIACDQVLKLFSSTSGRVYSYKNDFTVLWEMLESDDLNELISGDKLRSVTIVWDGIPTRGETATLGSKVDVGRYVSPLDWAVAFSLTVADKVRESESENYPPIKVHVLNLASHSMEDSPATQFFNLFSIRHVKAIPWIRLYRATNVQEAWSFLDLIRDASDGTMPSMQSLASASSQKELETIRRVWVAGITQPANADDHHAIANLIGPMLLMKDSTNTDVHVQALRCLLNSIQPRQEDAADGHSDDLLSAEKPWIDWNTEVWKEKLQRMGGNNKKLKLLLLDDQWQDGWGEVICKAIGATYTPLTEKQSGQFVRINSNAEDPCIVVKACKSLDWLVEEPNGILWNKTDNRFCLNLDASEDGLEILFLDLRLFAGKSVTVEAGFIEKLVEIAKRLRQEGNLPWPGFEDSEIFDISKWVAETKGGISSKHRNDPRYHRALTLLPRIISLIDLSYPIILFSSTGRREIVDKLKEYGNIITDLDKPSVMGTIQNNLPSQARMNFRYVIGHSLALLQSRNRCLAFFNAKAPYKNANRPETQDGRAYHIEFYIDETDPDQSMDDRPTYRKGWRVGGCFALFDGETEKAAREKSDRFEDILVEHGVRYFEWKYNGAQPKAVLAKKKHLCTSQIRTALESSQETGCTPVCLGVASLYQRIPEGRGLKMDLLDPRHDDQLFITTLGALVEAFLCESVPALTSNRPTSISLFAATRINLIEDKNTENISVDIARREQYRAGIGWEPYKGRGVKQDSFREKDYAPLVRNIVRRRGIKGIHRALAIQLPYAEKDQQPKAFVCRTCEQEIIVSNREKAIYNQIQVGQVFRGTVKERAPSGFVMEIYPGITGLVCESDVFPINKVQVGSSYCGTVVRILSGGSVLVDFGADSWGRLPTRYVSSGMGIGDQINVTLERKSFDQEKSKMLYELASYPGDLAGQSSDSELASDVMCIGSQHLVKVINKQGFNLRLSRSAVIGLSEPNEVFLVEPTVCESCNSMGNVHPDNRALHYTADQVLTDMFGNGRRKYANIFGQLVPGEFEEGWDEGFLDVLEASRALDAPYNDVPKAVLTYPLDANRICKDSEGKVTKPAIRDQVKWRIGRSLENISGNTFINILRQII